MKKISNNVRCSECGSINTVMFNEILYISSLMIVTGCVGMFISLVIPLFWIAIPIMFILSLIGAIGLVIGIFIKRYVLVCNDCKSKFQLSKEEYIEAKNK